MKICAALDSDLPHLARLHARCFSDAWSIREFQNLLGTGNVFSLMVGGAEPQGFIVIRTAADEAEVLSLGVAPQARRQGMALALMRAGATEAFARGARRLFLEVNVNNAAACALYGRLGFDEIGRRTGYYREAAGAEDALILGCDLPIST